MVQTSLVPDFTASIVVNNAPLHEYTDPDLNTAEDPSLITKFVESVAGASWAVRVTLGPKLMNSGYSWSLALYADGNILCDYVLFTPSPLTVYRREWSLDIAEMEWNEGETTRGCGFRFSSIKTNDAALSASEKEMKQRLEKLGVIELRLHRAKTTKRIVPKAYVAVRPCLAPDEVSERAMKGSMADHTFGMNVASVKTLSMMEEHWTDVEEGPRATFRFRHASRDTLKKHKIIPRSPDDSPTPEGDDDRAATRAPDAEIGEMTEERLRKRIRELTQGPVMKKRKIEEEVDKEEEYSLYGVDGEDSVEVTSERPVKRMVMEWGSTVDLTEEGEGEVGA